VTADTVRALVERFERTYEDTYGRGAGFRQAGIEITTFRVDATGRKRKPRLARFTSDGAAPRRKRQIFDWEQGRRVTATVMNWADMSSDDQVVGPAVLEHPTTTVFVGSAQEAAIDGYGNLIVKARS
jgi:N-methylhydantoinase A